MSNNRVKKVYTGMSQAEYKLVQAKADKYGYSVGEYMRQIAIFGTMTLGGYQTRPRYTKGLIATTTNPFHLLFQ